MDPLQAQALIVTRYNAASDRALEKAMAALGKGDYATKDRFARLTMRLVKRMERELARAKAKRA